MGEIGLYSIDNEPVPSSLNIWKENNGEQKSCLSKFIISSFVSIYTHTEWLYQDDKSDSSDSVFRFFFEPNNHEWCTWPWGPGYRGGGGHTTFYFFLKDEKNWQASAGRGYIFLRVIRPIFLGALFTFGIAVLWRMISLFIFFCFSLPSSSFFLNVCYARTIMGHTQEVSTFTVTIWLSLLEN